MNDVAQKISAGIAAIIGLAVLAIVISQRANTENVLSAFFQGLSNLVGVAISPVTGQSVSNLQGGLPGGGWTSGSTSGFSVSTANNGFGNIGGILAGGGTLAAGLLGSGGIGSLLGGSGSGGGIGSLFGGGGGGDFIDSGTWD